MLWKFFRLPSNEALKYAVAAALTVAVIVVVIERRDTRVLAGNIGITAYSNGIAVVQVPYRRDGGAGAVTILVDGQTVVRAMPAYPIKYGNDNYFFRASSALNERVLVRVAFDSDRVAQAVIKTVKVTHAGESAGDRDESAPNTAAEAVIALAKSHNADDKLPADQLTIVKELKREMRWTVANGVTPEHFVSGLNLWATKKGLPIRTEKITGKMSALLDAVSQTLNAGGTAQIYLKFGNTGRMVGVTRVVRAGGDIFLGIRDSAGPSGTDVYRVRDGVLVDYAFSDGPAVVGWGFVQTWNK